MTQPTKKHIHSRRSDQGSQSDNQSVDRWKYRRIVVFASTLFTAVVIGYLTLYGKDDTLRKEIVSDLLSGETWVILGYTFGALIDDNMRTGKFGANFIRHKMDTDRSCGSDPNSDPDMGDDSSSQSSDDHHGP